MFLGLGPSPLCLRPTGTKIILNLQQRPQVEGGTSHAFFLLLPWFKTRTAEQKSFSNDIYQFYVYFVYIKINLSFKIII